MADQSKARTRNFRNDVSAEYVRSLIHYDPEAGVFTWKPRPKSRGWKEYFAGRPAGSAAPWALVISLNSRKYLAHRLAWVYMTGKWPVALVDHKDGNPLNNRWDNLRQASQSQNLSNRPQQRNNTSGYKGVIWHGIGKKWMPRIDAGGKSVYLGLFDDILDAHNAYCEAAKEHHGEFQKFGCDCHP